jgi:hypothetical protein
MVEPAGPVKFAATCADDTKQVALQPQELMSRGDQDRRRHTRYSCNATAEVLVYRSRLLFRGRVCDLSESGCFVETRARLELRAMALVELTIQAGGVELRTLACARSIQPGRGAGFEFVLRDPRLHDPLAALLKSIGFEAPECGATSASAAAGIRP